MTKTIAAPDAWKKVKPGTQPMPEPLAQNPVLWDRVARRLGQDPAKGVVQTFPVIGGRKRYARSPLTSWILPDGTILTLTPDDLEAKVWNHLKGANHLAFPKVYDAFSLRKAGADAPDLFAIHHERLTFPPDPDWEAFIDSFFKWRAMAGDALKEAKAQDLEDFLRWVYDAHGTDPTTTNRDGINKVVDKEHAKARALEVKETRDRLQRMPDLEGMIAWAKDALAFLHKNHVKFRDLDPSNLGKTMDGRTVITNIAESRSGPKGRRDLGVLESAAKGLAVAWRTDPHGAVRGIMGYLAKSNTVRADAYQDTTPKYPGKPEPKPEPVAQAEAPAAPKAPAPNPSALAVAQAVKTIRKLARHMERDADSVSEESRHFDEQDAAALVDLVEALEKAYKKAAKELVQLR